MRGASSFSLGTCTKNEGHAANLVTRDHIQRDGNTSLAIVIGYGPVGRRVACILREFSIQPVIIDLNVDTISTLLAQGHQAVYGDGSRPNILLDAGIDRAGYLLITLPNLEIAVAAASNALPLNPKISILVRARYLAAQSILQELGVAAVSFEEEEVAKAMADTLLKKVKGDSSLS